ncbi:MAG: PepSY domain-containing protein [Lachnospiraceae bacterium]|nr:PepSY domain-containing protein [Lachnospiraceae bacterium]
MKRKLIVAGLIIAGISMFSAGSVFAAGKIAKSSAITEENAQNFALIDAGISADDVEMLQTDFDFENGFYVYEVDFISDGMKYEYTINSTNGKIIEKEIEKAARKATDKMGRKNPAPKTAQPEKRNKNRNKNRESGSVSIEQAKTIALTDAGFSADKVVFSKAKLDREDGVQVYEVEFYTADGMEYEYDIHAASGAILSKDIDVDD